MESMEKREQKAFVNHLSVLIHILRGLVTYPDVASCCAAIGGAVVVQILYASLTDPAYVSSTSYRSHASCFIVD